MGIYCTRYKNQKLDCYRHGPQAFTLGRQSIKHSTVQAAEVDREEVFEASDQNKEEEPSNIPSSSITVNIYSSAMSTTAALTLAGTATTGTQSQFMGFSRKGKGPMFPPYVPGGGGPSGSGSGDPPGGGGGPPGGGGGPPGGGGFFPAIAPGAAGGGGGRLGGNPPRIFDRTRSEADTFMNEFSLYRLTNLGADQVDNPMKRAALLLGFIQGETSKIGSSAGQYGPLANTILSSSPPMNIIGTLSPEPSKHHSRTLAPQNTLRKNSIILASPLGK